MLQIWFHDPAKILQLQKWQEYELVGTLSTYVHPKRKKLESRNFFRFCTRHIEAT